MEAARSDESNQAGNSSNSHTWKNWLSFHGSGSSDKDGGSNEEQPSLSVSFKQRAGGFLSGMLDREEQQSEEKQEKQRRKGKNKSKALLRGDTRRKRSKSISSTASEKNDDDKHDANETDSDGDSDTTLDDGDSASSSDDEHAATDEEDLDPENLMWEAQMALISHEYRSALKKLKKAIKHGSSAACLSLGNIRSKGLSCSEHDKKHNHESIEANIPQAARYYIQGLELEHERSEGHNNVEDDVETEEASSSLSSLNTEVVQDIAHGLCLLYRHGKIRPEHEESPVLRPRSTPTRTSSASGKTKKPTKGDKYVVLNEKDKSTSSNSMQRKESTEKRTSAWERGGQIAQPLIRKLEQLLGYSPAQDTILAQEEDIFLMDNQSDTPTKSHKKGVSFSRLPPKHRSSSSLDPISSRQARSALVHLYYISALYSFSEGSIAESRTSWSKIKELGERKEGTGSKEADEILEKAIVRLGMLEKVDEIKEQQEHQAEKKAGNMFGAAPVVELHQILSPVDVDGSPIEPKGFNFQSFAIASPVEMDTSTTNILPSSSSTRLPSSSKDVKSSSSKDVKNGLMPSQPAPPIRSVSATSHNSSSTAMPITGGPSRQPSSRKPKFSIPDSPTSTVRSYSSIVKGKGPESPSSSSKRQQGQGFLSVSNGHGHDAKGKGRQQQQRGGDAPWLIRSLRSTSSTSVSQLQKDDENDQSWETLGSSSTSHRGTQGIGSAAPSSRLQASNPASTRRTTQALFRPSVSKAYTTTHRNGSTAAVSAAPPSIAVSDPSTSNLNYITPSVSSHHEIRNNATSVASLPHYSTSSNSDGRSFSAAHLLLNRSSRGSSASLAPSAHRGGGFGNRQRKDSSSSLASFTGGVQKSFSSLRNFFSSTTTLNRLADTESVLDEEEDGRDDFERERDEAAQKLKQRLLSVAEKHDKAIAEIEAQEAQWGHDGVDYDDEDPYGDQQEDATEDSPDPPSLESAKGTITQQNQAEPMPVRSGSANALAAAVRKPIALSMSIPSSSLMQPSWKVSKSPTRAQAEPGSTKAPTGDATATNSSRLSNRPLRRRDFQNREFYQRDPTSASITPRASTSNLRRLSTSSHSSSSSLNHHTPKEVPGPLKTDAVLAALESASRVNVTSRCAVCGKKGVNFPKCNNKCGLTFCSRECRIESGGEQGRKLGKHVC